MNLNGKEILQSPLTLNIWRAPLANELDNWNAYGVVSSNRKEGYGWQVATEFYSTGIDHLTHNPITIEAVNAEGTAVVSIREIACFCDSWNSSGIESLYTFTITGDGLIKLHHTTGYRTGIYKSTVQEMYEPYLIPQDYGLRTDNRWVKMTDANGTGLQFKVNEKFNFNAHPYSTENLTKAVYTYQLQEQDGITFNLDYATSGTGCTARSIFTAYRAMPQLYEREIVILPVKN